MLDRQISLLSVMNIKKYGAIVTHIGERVILLQISCLHTVFLDKLGNVNLFLCVFLFVGKRTQILINLKW